MLPTGCRPIDELLGGGLCEGVITQVYGGPGTGKTNLCLFTAYTNARLGNKILFIDTETSFHEKRVSQIFKDKKALENVKLHHVSSFEEEEKAIELAVEEDADLLIIDSFTSLYRVERDETNSYETTKRLGKLMLKLLNIAREKNIPVLVTNQIYTNIETNYEEPIGGDVMKYYSKIILELKNNGYNERKAILKKHLFKNAEGEAKFAIVENGLVDF